MSGQNDTIIEKALAKLAALNSEVRKTKIFINQACEYDDRPPMFEDVGDEATPVAHGAAPAPLPPDAYFGKPLATAVRLVLEARAKRAGGSSPATLEDIHEQLSSGGFDFSSKDVANQKTGLGVSLSKNSPTFRRLPNGMWGLVEWYGAPPPKARKKTNGNSESPASLDVDAPETPASEDVVSNEEDREQ